MADVSYLTPSERSSLGMSPYQPQQTSADFLNSLRSGTFNPDQVRLSSPNFQFAVPNQQTISSPSGLGMQMYNDRSNPTFLMQQDQSYRYPNLSPSALKTESEYRNILLSVNDFNNQVKNNPYADSKGVSSKREEIMSFLDTTPGVTKSGNDRIVSTAGDWFGGEKKSIELSPISMDSPATRIFFEPTQTSQVPKEISNTNKDFFATSDAYTSFISGQAAGTEKYGRDVKPANINPFVSTDMEKKLYGNIEKGAEDYAKESGIKNPFTALTVGALKYVGETTVTSDQKKDIEQKQQQLGLEKQQQLKDIKVTELSGGPVVELGAQVRANEIVSKVSPLISDLKLQEEAIKDYELKNPNDVDKINQMKDDYNKNVIEIKPQIDELKNINLKLQTSQTKYEDVTQAYESAIKDTGYISGEKIKDVLDSLPLGTGYLLQPSRGVSNLMFEPNAIFASSAALAVTSDKPLETTKNVLTDPRFYQGALNVATMGLSELQGYKSTIDAFGKPQTYESLVAKPTGQTLAGLEVIEYGPSKTATKQVLTELGLSYGVPAAFETSQVVSGKKSISEGIKDTLAMGGAIQTLTYASKGAAEFGSIQASDDIKNAIQDSLNKLDTQGMKFVVAETPKAYLGENVAAKADIRAYGENVLQTKYGNVPIKVEARTTNIQGKSVGEKIPMSALGSETRVNIYGKHPGEYDYGYIGQGYVKGNKLEFLKQQDLVPVGYMDQFKGYLKEMGYNDKQVSSFVKGQEPGPISINQYGERYIVPETRKQIIDNFMNKYGLENVREVKSSGYSFAYPEGGQTTVSPYSTRENVYSKKVDNKPTIFASGIYETGEAIPISAAQETGLLNRITRSQITENPIMDIQRAGEQYSRISPTTNKVLEGRQTIQETPYTLVSNVKTQTGSKLSYGYSGVGEDLNVQNIFREIGSGKGKSDLTSLYIKPSEVSGLPIPLKLGVSQSGVPSAEMDVSTFFSGLGRNVRTPEVVTESLLPSLRTAPEETLTMGSEFKSLSLKTSDSNILSRNVQDIISGNLKSRSFETGQSGVGIIFPVSGETSNIKTQNQPPISILETPGLQSAMKKSTVLEMDQIIEPSSVFKTTSVLDQTSASKMSQSYQSVIENTLDITPVNTITDLTKTDTLITPKVDILSLTGLAGLTMLKGETVTPPVNIGTGGLGGFAGAGNIPSLSLPGGSFSPVTGNRPYMPKKSTDPLADYRIFFKRRFGYLGAPGVTKTMTITKPKYTTESDVGDFSKRIKELI